MCLSRMGKRSLELETERTNGETSVLPFSSPYSPKPTNLLIVSFFFFFFFLNVGHSTRRTRSDRPHPPLVSRPAVRSDAVRDGGAMCDVCECAPAGGDRGGLLWVWKRSVRGLWECDLCEPRVSALHFLLFFWQDEWIDKILFVLIAQV